MKERQRILLVEDDRKLAPLVRTFLEDHHFEVSWVPDGDEAWGEFERLDPDLVVLDLMLPGRDGLSLCKSIRSEGDTGILILTAKGDESDRIVGLELGADDYLTKPFSLGELLARLRAILRRYRPAPSGVTPEVREVGPFAIHLSHRSVTQGGSALELTRTEFDLLERMTRAPGRVFTRDELLDAVRGGNTAAFDRAVDRHISNLRAKIEIDPGQPEFVVTVWGVGYRWGSAC